MARHVLTGGSWFIAGQNTPVKASINVFEHVSSFAPATRNFANNDQDSKQIKVGSTGVFRSKNDNDIELIGEVYNITNGVITIIEYALWLGGERQVTRFCRNSDNNPISSVYNTCLKDTGGNLILTKLPFAKTRFLETDIVFVEMLDISRKIDDHSNLINTNKFVTFWWVLSHKNVLIKLMINYFVVTNDKLFAWPKEVIVYDATAIKLRGIHFDWIEKYYCTFNFKIRDLNGVLINSQIYEVFSLARWQKIPIFVNRTPWVCTLSYCCIFRFKYRCH